MSFYYEIARTIIKIFHLFLSQDCRVYGDVDYPTGAKIIAGNHPNATDGLFLPFVFSEKLHFFVQSDIFDIPVVGWLLGKSDQIPVIPDQKSLALRQAVKILRQGKVIALFPEARLNPDGQSIQSDLGAVWLSMITNAPIIPVGFYVPRSNLHYFKRMKEGRVSQGHWQTHGHCYLHIGSPWIPGEKNNGHLEKDILVELTDQLMDKIQHMTQLAMHSYTEETGLPAELASFNQS